MGLARTSKSGHIGYFSFRKQHRKDFAGHSLSGPLFSTAFDTPSQRDSELRVATLGP